MLAALLALKSGVLTAGCSAACSSVFLFLRLALWSLAGASERVAIEPQSSKGAIVKCSSVCTTSVCNNVIIMTLLQPHQPPRLSGLCLFVAAYVSLFAIAGVLLFGPGIFPRSNLPLVDNEGLRWPYAGSHLINCSSLRDVTQLEFVAGGWTKAVYKGRYNDRAVAVKTVNLNGHDLQECQGRGDAMPVCYRKAAAKIIKEMILLTELPHQNIVKVNMFLHCQNNFSG